MEQFQEITERIKTFIEDQKMFFVATAAKEGRVNLSPKGADSFRVLGPNRVIWLNLTGSGNETAAHLLDTNRMTIMFCGFEGKPNILRLYGSAKAIHTYDENWEEYAKHFPEYIGSRQIFDVEIDLVQTSCGFQVPFYNCVGERDQLEKWAKHKGKEGVKEYWKEKNLESIDGLDTGMKV